MLEITHNHFSLSLSPLPPPPSSLVVYSRSLATPRAYISIHSAATLYMHVILRAAAHTHLLREQSSLYMNIEHTKGSLSLLCVVDFFFVYLFIFFLKLLLFCYKRSLDIRRARSVPRDIVPASRES